MRPHIETKVSRDKTTSARVIQARILTQTLLASVNEQISLNPQEQTKLTFDILEGLSALSAILNMIGDDVDNQAVQAQRFEGFLKVGQVMESSLDINVVLQQVMDTIIDLTGAESCSLMLINDEGKLKLRLARNMKGETIPQSDSEVSRSVVKTVAETGQAVLTTNAQEDARFDAEESIMAYLLQSILCVPLKIKDRVTGVIYAENRIHKGLFQEREKSLLTTFASQAAVAIENASLFADLEKSRTDLEKAYNATLEGWARALDLRDKATEGHTMRVTELTIRLAKELGISADEIEQIRRGAVLHDIGKIGIPDHILRKAGPLAGNEWEVMRKHPVYAYQMLINIEYLRPAMHIPYCHHERFNGEGYPQGLKGDEIPLAARIFSIVDVYDALRSDRPYRAPVSEKETIAYIQKEAGRYFDPELVKAFIAMDRSLEGNPYTR